MRRKTVPSPDPGIKTEAATRCHLAVVEVLHELRGVEDTGDVAALWIAQTVEAAAREGRPVAEVLERRFDTWWEQLERQPSLLGRAEREAADPQWARARRAARELLSSHFGDHAWEPRDEAVLGAVFEGQLLGAAKRRHGQFYTPPQIVAYLLEHALSGFDPVEHPDLRLLDPACGAGNFLVAAARVLFRTFQGARARLREAHPHEAWDDPSLLRRIFARHLHGADLNPWALRLADVRLRLVQMELAQELGLGVMFAQEAQLARQDLRLHRDDTLNPAADAFFAEPFHVVVGNPPYGADVNLAQKSAYQQRYRLGRGRFDTTALFVERSLELLAPGGRLGFVVPHGITRTGAYAPLRQLLLSDGALLRLLDLGCVFKGVNLETMAFVVGKPHPGRVMTPQVHLDSLRDGTLAPVGSQDRTFFAERPTFPMYVPREATSLVAKLEAAGTPLSQLARIRRGIGISARSPHLIATGGIPVIRGRDIARFGPLDPETLLGWQPSPGGDLLGRDEAGLPLGLWHPDPLEAPHVGFQNIASGVVATMLPAGCVPLDTVNLLDPQQPWDPAYLLVALNSRLIEWYFHRVVTNRAQLTVHLDAPTVGSLPILVPSEADQRAIGGLGERLLDLHARLAKLDPKRAAEGAISEVAVELAYQELVAERHRLHAEAAKAWDEAEQAIQTLYGLTTAEARIVKDGVKAPKRPAGPTAKELAVALAAYAGA